MTVDVFFINEEEPSSLILRFDECCDESLLLTPFIADLYSSFIIESR
jgi:hypothetical protein